MSITILGSSGFIGTHIAKHLAAKGIDFITPLRDEDLSGQHLGTVIYCIGLTADFRLKPLETVEAHVCKLHRIIKTAEFDSLTYLSSTRIYGCDGGTAVEDDSILIHPETPDHLYNASKVMGESLLLSSGRNVKIARLSNVYGSDLNSDNFLSSIFRDAVHKRKVILGTSLESAKDYISISDTVDLIIRIASEGVRRIYNVASGMNTSNHRIMDIIRTVTGCEIEVDSQSQVRRYPVIDIERIRTEFGYEPSDIIQNISTLIKAFVQLGETKNDSNRS